MEDLRTRGAVQAGYFFGANSCLNVGKDLQAETAAFPAVTDTDVALSAFLSAADMHGSYWCDRALLESPELDLLKGRGWMLGAFIPCFALIGRFPCAWANKACSVVSLDAPDCFKNSSGVFHIHILC